MLIQHQQKENHGQFFIPEGEEVLAEMTYIRHDPKTMIINHTEVDEALRGQNFGYQLVQAAVEYARTHQLKIVPVCVFARAVFDKKPEYRDVLCEEQI
ncbi:N-acetyltransferase [Flaviaesturariibacter flavus]|uniref:N-acetyltransferase n=1 Tax=Flaviaesturariibacter flavus TaxID=2502780 RepID=A0A4R1B9Y5_9BACT|nr:GNAT family N-acetyltransferase [Flaviaesturariibacter flavus]TCJ13751.1 N-acetyltransferase [Flaviaesturariibacter flavus]